MIQVYSYFVYFIILNIFRKIYFWLIQRVKLFSIFLKRLSLIILQFIIENVFIENRVLGKRDIYLFKKYIYLVVSIILNGGKLDKIYVFMEFILSMVLM